VEKDGERGERERENQEKMRERMITAVCQRKGAVVDRWDGISIGWMGWDGTEENRGEESRGE